MASYEVLKQIVSNGSDLTLTHSVSYELVRELAAIASTTGARLTVTTHMSYELLLQLSSEYGRTIAFIDGLDKFKPTT